MKVSVWPNDLIKLKWKTSKRSVGKHMTDVAHCGFVVTTLNSRFSWIIYVIVSSFPVGHIAVCSIASVLVTKGQRSLQMAPSIELLWALITSRHSRVSPHCWPLPQEVTIRSFPFPYSITYVGMVFVCLSFLSRRNGKNSKLLSTTSTSIS